MPRRSPAPDPDPVRQAVLTAMDRMLSGRPQRSNGRLNVSQLAIEAGVQRWHLTHQHTDLKKLFAEKIAAADAQRAAHHRSPDALRDLQEKHAELQAHCRELEERLQLYATALNLLSLEHAALSGRDAESAKVFPMPRRQESG